MKALMIGLFMMLISIALYTNPMGGSLISEVWFNDNGHLLVEFHPIPDDAIDFTEVYFVHGDDEVQNPYSGEIHWYDPPLVFDLTQLNPAMVFDPAEDSLIVRQYHGTGYYDWHNLHWGSGFSNDINPPLPGQSIAVFYDSYYYCKDEPPTPGANAYDPVARDTLKVVVTDENGNPVPNVQINTVIGFPVVQYHYTDGSGVYIDTLYASRLHMEVRHPVTNEVVLSQYFWLEPNQTTEIPIQITMTGNDDEVIPTPAIKGLKAYPVPFNASRSGFISFSYDGNARLVKDSYIRLYDAKGRFVTQIPVSPKGVTNWTPPADTASGMYIARLISGNRFVDTVSFSIIK
jgi:hypothetical protein